MFIWNIQQPNRIACRVALNISLFKENGANKKFNRFYRDLTIIDISSGYGSMYIHI